MSSTADAVELMKTQKQILTEIEKLTRDFKNRDPSCFNALQVSESSDTYTITGRIDPFLKRNVKVTFSEDKKYLIMDASHEVLFNDYTTSHQMARKFKIEDKYSLDTTQIHIVDNLITITIKAKDQRFSELEKAPEQVTRKKEGQSMKAAADDDDLDMTTTSEGELLPRYVVERTTIDREVLQRKIELSQFLCLVDIDDAYVEYREHELEPCPEFERQIDEMLQKRSEQKLTEKGAPSTSQSAFVPEGTDTSVRREKPVERTSGVQSQEIADDSEEKKEAEEEYVEKSIEEAKTKTESAFTEEETLSEASKKTKGKQQAPRHEGEKSERETPTKQERKEDEEKVGKKESKESLPESTLAKQEEKVLEVEEKDDADSKETAPKTPPQVSKQQPDEGEEREDKDSKGTVPKTPPQASKQQTGEDDKAAARETPGSKGKKKRRRR